jgi:chromosome segregation ATPase
MIGSALEKTVSMHRPASNRPIEPIEETLMTLARDIKAIRQQGTPKISQVQELAERIFEASMLADKRLAQLGQERERLSRFIEASWKNYEATVLPLWKVEEELVPVYDELAETSQALDRLSLSSPDESRERQVQDCQRRLNDLENRVVVDGKFVPSGWSKEGGGKIPAGQAILAQMMHRCYKKAHALLEATDGTLFAFL